MKFGIFISFLFIVSINAQYYTAIPCQTDLTCKNVLDPNRDFKCVNGICLCANPTTKAFQECSLKDFIIGAARAGSVNKTHCDSDADCSDIKGAKCYNEPFGNAKVCDCQPDEVRSSDGRRCLSIAIELNKPCNETVQCSAGLDGAECKQGYCRCRPNFHYVESKKRCTVNKGFGDPCTREEENCFQLVNGKNALGCSDNNLCKCLKDYTVSDGECQRSGASRSIFVWSLMVVTVLLTTQVM